MARRSAFSLETCCGFVVVFILAGNHLGALTGCAGATLTGISGTAGTCPLGGGSCAVLPFNTAITWQPVTCQMVVQGYQNGNLTGAFGSSAGVASGTVFLDQLTNGKEGETQVKIWVPQSASPSDAAFAWTTAEFADDFETDKGWGKTEELVASCYVTGAGSVQWERGRAGTGCYWDEHELVHNRREIAIPFPKWEWAEVDDSRLVWAEGGALHSGKVNASGCARPGFQLI